MTANYHFVTAVSTMEGMAVFFGIMVIISSLMLGNYTSVYSWGSRLSGRKTSSKIPKVLQVHGFLK